MKLIFIALCLFSLKAFAQSPRVDWRLDQMAFRSHTDLNQKVLPINQKLISLFPDVKIDPNFLKTKLSEFSGAAPVMVGGKQMTIAERGSDTGRAMARAYLAQEYSKLGFVTSTQPYSRGENFVAEKVGANPNKILILSAHLDSVHNAGADDDGAGTISALAIATALSKTQLAFTLRIVGFDQEEDGLVGSTQYVKYLQANGEIQKVIADINLEMTAYDGKNLGRFHVMDCNRADSLPLSRAVMAAVTKLAVPLTRSQACTDRSDHAAFWNANKPAIVISEDFFGGNEDPCYHQTCDKIPNLNFQYMANITSVVTSVVAAELSAQ